MNKLLFEPKPSSVVAVHDAAACPVCDEILKSKDERPVHAHIGRHVAEMILRRCEAGTSSFVCTRRTQATGTACKGSAHETTLTVVVILSVLCEAKRKNGHVTQGKLSFQRVSPSCLRSVCRPLITCLPHKRVFPI